MVTRRQFLKWATVSAAGPLSGLIPRPASAEPSDELAIIVAPKSPITDLSRFELKRLYLGTNITTRTGERIIAFNQVPNAPDRILFEQRVLEMSSEELARYWIERRIRGHGGAPKAVSPVDLLQKVVSRLDHSVAYVRAANVLPDVRVIPIDGRLPGEQGYDLLV